MHISLEEGKGFVEQQFKPEQLEENIMDVSSGYAYMQGLDKHDGDRSKNI